MHVGFWLVEVVVISPNIQQSAVPIGSMEKVYVPSLAIKISQMLVNTSYMDPMAYKSRPKMSRPVPPPPVCSLIQCAFDRKEIGSKNGLQLGRWIFTSLPWWKGVVFFCLTATPYLVNVFYCSVFLQEHEPNFKKKRRTKVKHQHLASLSRKSIWAWFRFRWSLWIRLNGPFSWNVFKFFC